MKIISLRLSFLSLALLTSACVHTDQTWVRSYEGNQIEIKSGRIGAVNENKHYVTLTNTNRQWVGPYAGGETKVPMRKAFLLAEAQAEARVACEPNGFIENGAPDYSMLDSSPMAYGGGLLGYAIAAGMSDYSNLPTALNYHFKCSNVPATPVAPVALPGVAPSQPVITAPAPAPADTTRGIATPPPAQQTLQPAALPPLPPLQANPIAQPNAR